MTRAQCIVHREAKLLMVQHHHNGRTWWCLPGGSVEPGETPAEAALRELREESCVGGVIICETSRWTYLVQDETYTYLVDIGDQTPSIGTHPSDRALINMKWMTLSEISEQSRAFLWAAGLLGVVGFWAEVSGWGDSLSYPGDRV